MGSCRYRSSEACSELSKAAQLGSEPFRRSALGTCAGLGTPAASPCGAGATGRSLKTGLDDSDVLSWGQSPEIETRQPRLWNMVS